MGAGPVELGVLADRLCYAFDAGAGSWPAGARRGVPRNTDKEVQVPRTTPFGPTTQAGDQEAGGNPHVAIVNIAEAPAESQAMKASTTC